MPKRTDLRKILIIGSGPIVIGQACEFDYSGTQACKALRQEGYQVVLVNSNPATIMTDPEMSDRTYIEPVDVDVVAKIIEKERPDALLPTLGGQTGLNTAVGLWEQGVLQQYGVEMIGANYEAIHKAEDREAFKKAMGDCGLDLPRSVNVRARMPARPKVFSREAVTQYEADRMAALSEAVSRAQDVVMQEIGFPCVIRPSFTLGGTGGGIAYNLQEFEELIRRGLESSIIGEVLVEESVIGWKEFELEVMRDKKDNVVIICSIENFDPMGVHTGDSITVAPAQTLTDKEYQRMRDASIAVIREIGVETGGSNIQFAVDPKTGRMVVIEMNPRVSRSSALASKATGFPIAKIAAKLAVGYTLDEIPNDITRETYASFEPTIDYCVVKFPRWAFEKFPEANATLTTQMKSVGEVMAIGRTFKESLQKALRSLETGRSGLGLDKKDWLRTGRVIGEEELERGLRVPGPERIFYIRHAFKAGKDVAEIAALTRIDPWFLDNVKEIVEFEDRLCAVTSLARAPADLLREAKRMGFSDVQLGMTWNADPLDVRARRKALGIGATFKLVDTCAAEFEAYTPYYYSTYEDEDETRITPRDKIVILGGGPNRIGQGIEFDYCCVHAAFALKELGLETIMVNSNPETVSTDYDTSDLLFFEPLTVEDVLNIVDRLKPKGVIVQFGGQTPLNIAMDLKAAGVPIIGTSPESIALAEDREQFRVLLDKLGLRQAPSATCWRLPDALEIAARIGFPVLMRPSFVLGGAKMHIIEDRPGLEQYWSELESYCGRADVEISQRRPILIDKFLDDAIEIDVDCICDGRTVVVGAVMEHIEQAGVHSGDSACAIPPYSLSSTIVTEIERQSRALAMALGVRGLMNVQYAVKDGTIYVLEVNPRASRTIPFVSKAIGVPLAKLAAKVMAGKTLQELGFTTEKRVKHYSVKEAALPFNKFPECDVILGPEMKSTGEVMGIDPDFGIAYAKSQLAVGTGLAMSGNVFLSVRDEDKTRAVNIGRRFVEQGLKLLATRGTWNALQQAGVPAELVLKVQEGRPNILDALANGAIGLVVNTPSRRGSRTAEAQIRRYAVHHNIPVITTLAAATAAVQAIAALKKNALDVRALQDYHRPPRP